MVNEKNEEIILTVSCPARSGIVAAITTFLYQKGGYISELSHFDDKDQGQLFLRCRFYVESGSENLETIQQKFPEVADKYEMQWGLVSSEKPTRTLLMVSQYDHCLDDLLYRLQKGELNMEITAVVSNHVVLRPMVERLGIRFVHLPVDKENKPQQEQALLDIIDETDSELVILARYMQILSDELCATLSGRVINIHHSFLPGFKGAKPYHQAYQRGVKLIGATAHYVTADLDEGPIISQEVQHVDHTYTPQMLVAVGRDTETKALADAVRLHTEHRVFLDGNKTIIFK